MDPIIFIAIVAIAVAFVAGLLIGVEIASRAAEDYIRDRFL